MKLIDYYPQLQKLHTLIRLGQTGTPKQFAQKLNISRAELYMIIDELRELDIPVQYSKKYNTFYYEKEINLGAKFTFGNNDLLINN
ncbi:MAG: hypothetical protein H6Q20_2486 [Bacteroidetes bacterium]|jgi:hypothetical protein|nr:hypothetical protein [Bacteroidota bacterium]